MSQRKKINNMKVTAELKGGKANIRIVDYIGEWTESSSRTVRTIVDEMLAGGATEASVYINSRGGDIFEAVEIANELSRFTSVKIQVGSVAASAATYIIAKFKANSRAKKNSQVMIHRPSAYLSGDIIAITARMKLLENTTNDYKATYATATGKTEDEIEKLWANGDYWMTAQEAKEQGFIAEVEEEEQQYTEDDVLILEACGAPNIPEIKKSNIKSTDMDKNKIIAALGLPADATDEQIETAAKEAREKADKLATVEASTEQLQKTKATALVALAITERKITADMKDHYEKFAAADYDGCSALFATMKGVAKPEFTPGNPAEVDKVRASWTLEDYLEKAPEALAEMEKNDKVRFDRLNDEYFNSKGTHKK